MTGLEALVLGVIQGVTEFIPISSSAHLLIIRWVFGWDAGTVAFDAVIHLGTLLALLLFFWREWYQIVVGQFQSKHSASDGKDAPMLLWPILFASIPAAAAGFVFQDTIDSVFRDQPLLTGAMLILMGLALYAADRAGRKNRPMTSVRLLDWVYIGMAQALALVPGVSRSGITITAGLAVGLEREAAARFSFLLGAPVILGAGVWELHKVMKLGLTSADTMPMVVGTAASAISGFFCIKFLIGYLKTRTTGIFVVYRVVLGLALIAASLTGHLHL